MSTNDYLKFVTQQIVSYIDSPKEERLNKRLQKRTNQAPFQNRWFGMIPFATMLLLKKIRRKKAS